MTDRRLLAANDRVAASELLGRVEAPRFVKGTWHRITRPVVDLLRSPGGQRERQLLFGQRVRVLECHEGYAFLQSERDGYVGYIEEDALGEDALSTHRVSVAATHLYPAPDMKQRELAWLSHGSDLCIVGQTGDWCETDTGAFVYAAHVRPIEDRLSLMETARLHLGTPYLWGGNSSAGIDCSGLVQAAMIAAGHPCPGDSDLQREALGDFLPEGTPPEHGDLFFWKGHVALVADAETLIHANAYHMAVAYEPIGAALARIAAKEFGELTAHKRLR